MTAPPLTYWRCPECGTRVWWASRKQPDLLWGAVEVWVPPTLANLEHAEALVEAHEARHLAGQR